MDRSRAVLPEGAHHFRLDWGEEGPALSSGHNEHLSIKSFVVENAASLGPIPAVSSDVGQERAAHDETGPEQRESTRLLGPIPSDGRPRHSAPPPTAVTI